MVAMEYHAATDLLRKQRPNESLQDYIAYWMAMYHISIKMHPGMINNKIVIVLFVKIMYNKEIHRRVVGAKNMNTLLDAFKSAQMNLLKLKKYEGLVSDDEHGHTVHAVNQTMSKGLDITEADRSLVETGGYSKQVSNQQQQMQKYGNPYQQLLPHFDPCYTCGVYGLLCKICL